MQPLPTRRNGTIYGARPGLGTLRLGERGLGASQGPQREPRLPAAPRLPAFGPAPSGLPCLSSGSRWAGPAAVVPQRGSLGAALAPAPPRAAWSLAKPTARALPDPAGYGPFFTSPSCGSPFSSFGAGAGPGPGPGPGGAPRLGRLGAPPRSRPSPLPSPAAHAALAGLVRGSENSPRPSGAACLTGLPAAGASPRCASGPGGVPRRLRALGTPGPWEALQPRVRRLRVCTGCSCLCFLGFPLAADGCCLT